MYMQLWYFIMVHGQLYCFFTICLDKHCFFLFVTCLCNVVVAALLYA